jgi:ABC-type nitrate/sulfonate/bicarbonate transport system permease component
VLLGVGPKSRDYGIPIAEVLRPIPSVALIPVFLLLFGITFQTIFWVVFLGCLWPILMAALYGVRQIDELLLDMAKALQLPKKTVLTKIILPAALPSIVGGIRISLAVSFISTVTCEMVLGYRGIGAYILENERSFRFPEMYGGIFMLSLSGLLTNRVFVFFEKRIIFWAREKEIV